MVHEEKLDLLEEHKAVFGDALHRGVTATAKLTTRRARCVCGGVSAGVRGERRGHTSGRFPVRGPLFPPAAPASPRAPLPPARAAAGCLWWALCSPPHLSCVDVAAHVETRLRTACPLGLTGSRGITPSRFTRVVVKDGVASPPFLKTESIPVHVL